MENLKACPFCGGTAEWNTERTLDAGAQIECNVCGAETFEYVPWDSAAHAWNAGLVFRNPDRKTMTAAQIIVTRHAGTVEWLKSHGVDGEVISHVSDPVQIVGKIVFGVLPLHLAAQAHAVVSIDMPDLPADKRGVDLTPAEMDSFGARMTTYKVTRA